ncbi:MAG: L-threonylcarbamoyladenylate synthase [Deltaproteobacteria bacterium]|nr:L-threonylcarbamoyladenylate synthase [Deltaproteobacteria bacterium]
MFFPGEGLTLIHINPDNPQERLINRVVDVLKEGGVIAYPTDTIYGIGCDIFNKKALERIYLLKGRDRNKPMSFVCSDLSHISKFAKVSNYAYRIMKRFLPGPYTFILEASSVVPRMLMPKRKTVGIRIPDNAIATMLVEKLGNPIISTSANVSGRDVISDPGEIDLFMGKILDLTIDAGMLPGEPSTIVDLTGDSPALLREGVGDYSWIG